MGQFDQWFRKLGREEAAEGRRSEEATDREMQPDMNRWFDKLSTAKKNMLGAFVESAPENGRMRVVSRFIDDVVQRNKGVDEIEQNILDSFSVLERERLFQLITRSSNEAHLAFGAAAMNWQKWGRWQNREILDA